MGVDSLSLGGTFDLFYLHCGGVVACGVSRVVVVVVVFTRPVLPPGVPSSCRLGNAMLTAQHAKNENSSLPAFTFHVTEFTT